MNSTFAQSKLKCTKIGHFTESDLRKKVVKPIESFQLGSLRYLNFTLLSHRIEHNTTNIEFIVWSCPQQSALFDDNVLA